MHRRRIVLLSVSVLLSLVSIAFLFQPSVDTSLRSPSSLEIPEEFFIRDLDHDLGEAFEENDFAKEKQYITKVVGTFLKFIREVKEKSANPVTTRGAHAKALACLKGEFEAQPSSLPENLRVGIFSQDKTKYKSWIRVSNSSQDPFSKDKEQNTRGFAIKLLGVDGEKLLGANESTLDLVHVASEAFVAKDNFNYSEIADGTEPALGLVWRLGLRRTRDLLQAVSKAKNEPNPLRLDYFSTVPYRLGTAQGPKKAIKFRLVLCNPQEAKKFPATTTGSENLVKNIAATMSFVEELCYNFQIQVSNAGDQVEDATTRWRGEYVTVGKLRISRADNPQTALTQRAEFCEHLSFNPWRTLEVHKPLGRINRARFATYQMSSTYRHNDNRTRIEEPNIDSFDKIP